jgi:uncharacterized protein (TIGR02588 family)
MAGKRSPSAADRIEWGLGILCAAVVLAIAGYLVTEATGAAATLPELHAEVVPPPPGEGPGQVRFVVRNDGGRTATAVALALVLRGPDGAPVAERRIVLDYLPGQSEATGGFVLPVDAGDLRPELVVEGYLDP